jgi:hypothetical protein
MSTDSPKTIADGEASAVTPPGEAPQLTEWQQAIRARAQETIARREAPSRRSRSQLLIALAVSLVLALIAFSGINYLVAEAQRMLAEYAASKKVESEPPHAAEASEPGVIILQPDRTLEQPSAPPDEAKQP